MNKFKNLINEVGEKVLKVVKKNKTLIFVIGIALVCSIAIAIGVYAQVTNKKIIEKNETVDEENYQLLKQDFNSIFNNKKNEYIDIKYDIEQDKQRTI
ncbi:MAG: hypothetical protein E7310_01310 [Clostridiales bacterium]|nr:hypothetical protein [Clostridiales bacterium]